MRAWTIQTMDVLAQLQSGRTWRAHEAHVQSSWRPAYRWMCRQMRRQLAERAARGQMPVWLWCQWRGADRARPDLRATGHLPPGTRAVRLELELERARVLQSDFELWHYVLNGWYLPASLQDERDFEAAPVARRIEPSWRRVFDLQWHDRRYTAPRAQRSIQGVTWDIRPDDLRAATSFVAR
jgi:hypothetical protein